MAKEENNDKNYAYIAIVAIVAVVALVVLFGNQRIAYNLEISSDDVIGEASRGFISVDGSQLQFEKQLEELQFQRECNPEWGIMIENICWQKQVSTSVRNHPNSLSYCQSLTLGGRTWDMPTKTEMLKLRNYACENKQDGAPCFMPCEPGCVGWAGTNLHNFLNSIGFSGFQPNLYWTKTTFWDSFNSYLYAYYVYFEDGHVSSIDVTDVTNGNSVVCVSRN